jgi:hypothetical protein
LGWKWDNFDQKTQERFEKKMIEILGKAGPIELSGILNSCEELEFSWKERPKLKKAVFHSINSCFSPNNRLKEQSGQVVANTIYYLGKTGLKWEECDEIKNSLFHKIENCSSFFKEQHVSNVIYGFVCENIVHVISL